MTCHFGIHFIFHHHLRYQHIINNTPTLFRHCNFSDINETKGLWFCGKDEEHLTSAGCCIYNQVAFPSRLSSVTAWCLVCYRAVRWSLIELSADVQLVISSIDCFVPLHITPSSPPPGQLLLIMNLEGAGERMRMAIDANKYTHAHIF